MRTVHDLLTAVLAAARPVAALDVVLGDAGGCILAETLTADHDVPPRDVAAYDGYALAEQDVAAPPTQLPGELHVVGDVPPWTQEPGRLLPGTAVRVASGSPIPQGAVLVVPLSATDRGHARVRVAPSTDLRRGGDGIRRAGGDVAAGEVVLRAGVRLQARHLAVAAALGRGRLRVHPAPRVVVVTVGDELTEPGRHGRAAGVRDAVGHALAAAVEDVGAVAVRVGPVGDDRGALREVLADQLVRADLLLVAGGLSAGPWDTVGDVLSLLGTVRLDQVAIAPGGRLAFGAVDDVPVIAVPGHPVSAQVAVEVFVRPALRAMAGHAEPFRPSVRAAVARTWASPPGLRQFVPATVEGSPTEGYTVTPVGDPSRPGLADLAHADALVVVAEDTTHVRAGDVLPCLVLEA